MQYIIYIKLGLNIYSLQQMNIDRKNEMLFGVISGIVHAQWGVDDDADQLPPVERRDWGITSYDPEYDWSKLETYRDDDNTLVNLLKRGRSYVSDSYKRLPRIKQIIPFYSYGDRNGLSGYRSRSRLSHGRRRKHPYAYNPWSRSYYSGRRAQTPIYASY